MAHPPIPRRAWMVLLALLVGLQCLCPVGMGRPAAGMQQCGMGQAPQPVQTTRPCCLASRATVAWLTLVPVAPAVAVTATFLPVVAVAAPPADLTAAAPDTGPPPGLALRI